MEDAMEDVEVTLVPCALCPTTEAFQGGPLVWSESVMGHLCHECSEELDGAAVS